MAWGHGWLYGARCVCRGVFEMQGCQSAPTSHTMDSVQVSTSQESCVHSEDCIICRVISNEKVEWRCVHSKFCIICRFIVSEKEEVEFCVNCHRTICPDCVAIVKESGSAVYCGINCSVEGDIEAERNSLFAREKKNTEASDIGEYKERHCQLSVKETIAK
jgi:hypothetical protein